MKHKHGFIVVIFLASFMFTGGADGEWRNSLKPAGKPSAGLTITQDSRPLYTILLPAKPSSAEQKAADDLQHWIKEITGATLPIASSAPGGRIIGIAADQTLAPDQYSIAATNHSLMLTGAPGRGVINAVYALLEEDVGCRWYTKSDTRLPHAATLVITPVARTYTPQLKMRDPFYFVSFDPDWSLHNRTSAPDAHVPEEYGGHIDYANLFVHTQHTLLPPEKYFKEHPEYYQMNPDGKRVPQQLCTTNPEVRKLVTEAVLDTLRKNPHTEVVSVSRLDIQQVCHCPECEKLRKDEGSEMANQLLLVNEVADAVAKEFPGVYVDTLAYLETLPVPKTMRPRANVIIRLCNDVAGAWSHPFTPAEQTGTAAYVTAWSKVHDRLSIWDYNVNFSHYLSPMPNMDVIAANIRYWVKNKAWGVMTQGGYQGAAERDEMRSWIIAKLMWDPTLDEKALVQDFIEGHYGPVAGPMAEYDELLVKAGKDHAKELASPPGGIRYPMTISFLSDDFLGQAAGIFAKARELAGANQEILHRVERAMLPLLYVQLSRHPEAQTLADFDRIAHREGATHLAEVWPGNLDAQIAAWRSQLPKPAAAANLQYKVLSKGPAALIYQAFPDVCRLKNGDLLAVFYAGYGHGSLPAGDYPNGGRICMTQSTDDGRTWSAPEILFDDVDDNRDPSVSQLDDGTVVCTFFSFGIKGPILKSSNDFSWKLFAQVADGKGAQIVFSHDNGHTWDKTATSILPHWYCSSPVRQLPDSTCLLGLYQENPEHKPNGTDAWGGVAISHDRCKTWSVPIPIGKDAHLPLDAETDVIPLKDGMLLAALRSSKVNMHYATSKDNGMNWSEVKDIGFKAQCPYLYRVSSGEILLAHRVPNTALHISRDEAKTWEGPYEIDSCIGAYPSMVELGDHSVLIVYYTEGPGSQIRAKRFRVTKTGIEFVSW